MSATPTAKPARGVGSKPETLTEQAYNRLEEMVVTLALAPGSVVAEQALSAELGIGRTPIREALQRLAREGLVLVLPRKAIIVTETDPRRQLLVLEVRRELERLLVRASAERATGGERRQFHDIAEGMEAAAKSNDDIAFMRLDQRFNILIATAARNEFARRSMGLMNALSRRFWYQHYQEVADLPLAAKLHAAVAEAVAQKKAKAAASASDRLIDYIEDFARKTLDS